MNLLYVCFSSKRSTPGLAILPPYSLLLASLMSRLNREQFTISSVFAPLRSTLHTLVKARGRLVGTANLHLSEVCHAALATFAWAFGCSWSARTLRGLRSTEIGIFAYLLSCPRSSSFLRRPARPLRPWSPCSYARSSGDRGSFGMGMFGIRSGSCRRGLGLKVQVRGV